MPIVSAPTPTHFFRNYRRTIGIAYGAILLGMLLFFVHQLSLRSDEELANLTAQVNRHAQYIEFVLRSSSDQVEALRMTLVGAAKPGSEAETSLVIKRSQLQPSADGRGFNRDALPDRDSGGNLVGLGDLYDRPGTFVADLAAAASLDESFRSLAFILPSASQARFVSVNDFEMASPWMPSAQRPFTRDVYQSMLWSLAQPAANPDRVKYWAPVAFAGREQGLFAPVAAPVYRGDRFMGVVAIDTSLDYLNRVNNNFGYKPGTTLIVDAYGKVLAQPDLYRNAIEVVEPPSLTAALSASVTSDAELAALPADTAVVRGGHYLVRHPFISAPWQLVAVVPQRELWHKLLVEHGAGMGGALAGLMLLMGVTYRVTSHEFVGPAAQLVAHLEAEARFEPAPAPRVPPAWRPWFEVISKAFRASTQLAFLKQELDIAARMQQAILPRHWPDDPDFTLGGVMRSAKEVGGDFYDHFRLAQGRLGLVGADVSGKGVPAALFGMVSKTLLRSVAMRTSDDPSRIVFDVNQALCEDNEACMFVTALYAVLDPADGHLRFVNAGHPPPLLVCADGRARFIESPRATALGLMEERRYPTTEVPLSPGDVVIIYTDGVTEAMNPKEQEYTPARLLALFEGRPVLQVAEAVERIVGSVDAFASGAPQSDDITVMVLQYHPRSVAPTRDGGTA
jgi:sigma-B regulation protein RsbU (phosphoserine phosphatase)